MSINPFGDAAEQLRARFYSWEQRGRGWQVYPHPVELEPPFRPFERFVRVPVAAENGRKPGLLLSALTLGLLGGRRGEEGVTEGEEEPEPQPRPAQAEQLAELHLLLPEDFKPSKDVGALLRAMQTCAQPVSVELIGQGGNVSLQLVCATADRANLSRQVASLAPEVAILPRDGHLAATWQAAGTHCLVADVGLSEEFMLPLHDARGGDSLVSIISALAEAEEDEVAIMQTILTPARKPWAAQILASLTDQNGYAFLDEHHELLRQARKKIASPLCACRLRVAVASGSPRRSRDLLRGLAASLQQFSAPTANSLIALDHTGWDEQAQESDLLSRTAHRSGMLLSADELALLVHLPQAETAATALERARSRTKAAPAEALGHKLVLGVNEHLGQSQDVSLSAAQRSRHLYIIGGSGTGKSTLLLNLICQDIEVGHGVGVLDPHGDLVDAVLARMPESRINDVVLIDPADAEYVVGINVLAAHSDAERTLLSSDLVSLFRRHATSWGDQMNTVFANAVLAFLESNQGGTLADLRRFLVEKEYRTAFLRTVQDPEVVYYWEREFPLLRGHPQAPILTRLDGFLRPKVVRHMVCSPGVTLDFRALMDERKILLVKLPQGGIGEENAYLLGGLIVSKLQQLALSRQDVEASDRPPFYLYLDEFQHFASPSTATLLSGVRKYGLGLTLAHQNLGQISGELIDSVLANAGTRICFRLGDADARKLADGFSYFEGRDLQNLDTGQAIARVGRAQADFNLTTYPAPAVDPTSGRARASDVTAASRGQYATPLSTILAQAPQLPPAEPDRVAALPPAAPPPESAERPPTAPISRPKLPPAPPAVPGRGGQQHKYLQTLVQKFGIDRGFKASVEQTVLDGHGSIDVVLEREGMRIACEITVTTPTAHELQNIHKCLAAGFDRVLLLATDTRAVKRVRQALPQALAGEEVNKVNCLTIEELPAFLDQLQGPSVQTGTVAGYKVTASFGSGADPNQKGKAKTISEIIARTLKRNRP